MDKTAKVKLLQLIMRGKVSKEILNVEPGTCFKRTENGKYQFRDGKPLSVEELKHIRNIVDLFMASVFIQTEVTPYAIIFQELHDRDYKNELLEPQGFRVSRFSQATCLTKDLADRVIEIFKDTRPLDDLTTAELIRRVNILRRADGEHLCPKCGFLEKLDYDVNPYVCPHCKFEHLYDEQGNED
jgi:predicted Zn-ribbon and HTH transcriptional regulator